MIPSMIGSIEDSQRQRCWELAQTLSWAVGSGVPLDYALRSLRVSRDGLSGRLLLGNPLSGTSILAVFSGVVPAFFLTFFFSPTATFQSALRSLIGEVESGTKLGESLSKTMGHILPAWYVEGVIAAEDAGMLVEVLPKMADSIRQSEVRQLRRLALCRYYIVLPVLAGLPLSFLMIQVVPKFRKMIYELSGGRPFPRGFEWLIWVADTFRYLIPILLSALFVCLAGMWIWRLCGEMLDRTGFPWPKRSEILPGLLEAPCSMIPLLRKKYRLQYQEQFLRCFELATRLRMPVDDAIVWVASATSNRWLRGQLVVLNKMTIAGVPWSQAWGRAIVDVCGVNWLVRNAAVRDRLAEGYALAAQQVNHSLRQHVQRLERYAFVVFTLLYSLVVGTVALVVLQTLAFLVGYVEAI